jgi:uncharacterized protein
MIKRSLYLEQIKQYIGNPIIKVITGMRRSGKTYFLRQIKSELEKDKASQIIHIDKEDLDFDFIKDYQDLNDYVSREIDQHSKKSPSKKYLLIDEVQEIAEWEKALRSLAKKDIEIFITGSNSHMLSSELATFISGRYIEFLIFPLSFKEFLDFRQVNDPAKLEEEFDNYLRYGAMPGIHNSKLDPELSYTYLASIMNTIILKDVVKRHVIQNYSNFEKLLFFSLDNFASTFSAKSISDYLKSQKIKISVDTIQNYLSFLESAFLIYKVKRFDIKGKRQLEIYEKYYLADLGFRHAKLKYRPEDIGDFLENIVFIELLRRGYTVSIGKLDDKEIDFIAEKANETLYIQVSYTIQDKQTYIREAKSLLDIKDNHPKYILTMDKYLTGLSEDGIIIKNIIDWLLV